MPRRPALCLVFVGAIVLAVAACGGGAPTARGGAAGGAGTPSGGAEGGGKASAGGTAAAGTSAGGRASQPLSGPSCTEADSAALPGYRTDDRLADFALVDEGGGSGRLSDRLVGCTGEPALLIVRIEAAFCGQCRLAADRVAPALAEVSAVPVEVLTVLYADQDNAPATGRDAAAWHRAHPSLPGVVAASADDPVRAAVAARHVLPLWLFVDRRNGVLLDVLENPAEDWVAPAVADAWQRISGQVVPAKNPSTVKIDGRFRPDEWALVQGMSPVPKPPPSPSNAFADDPEAAALGAKLIDDPLLGGGAPVSCSSCHLPEKGFSDGLPVAQGKGVGKLHTPVTALAAYDRWSFWDGRADSLWSQALGPIENPVEMDGTRLGVVARVKTTYRAAYEPVFGPLPETLAATGFPTLGKPGDPAWEALSEPDRTSATRVFVNVGKAIEAFERTRISPETRFDRYVAGEPSALTAEERDGLSFFLGAGCATCHFGPTLSNGAFHSIRVRSHDVPADRGRIDGVSALLSSPFRADGIFSDDPSVGAALPFLVSSEALLGQVKTPTLRNVARTGPWGHGGTFETLLEVVNHYAKPRSLPTPGGPIVGAEDPTLGVFVSGHTHPIEAFLGTLSNP